MAKQSQNLVFLLFVTALVTLTYAQEEQNPPTNSTRQGKVFSLFNVVQFKNSGCRSTSSISGGGTTSTYRNGTCFTASECQSKGGTSAGNCAAGFGVCCVFLVTASGSTISQNCTYIRNPGYPSTYSSTSAVSYTINKACPMYIDMGSTSSDSSTLAFSFAGTSSIRQWEIKVTQVPCGSKSTYSVCIRQELGYCCIQYTPCSDPNSFTINGKGMGGTAATGGIDTACDSVDYIQIAGSRAVCSTGTGNNGGLISRYCGGMLSSVQKGATSQPICDCTAPFLVGIYTDSTNKLVSTAISDSNRGVCLTWTQIPCAQQ